MSSGLFLISPAILAAAAKVQEDGQGHNSLGAEVCSPPNVESFGSPTKAGRFFRPA